MAWTPDFTSKKNDTKPDIEITVVDADGTIPDWTSATITFKMQERLDKSAALKTDRAGAAVSPIDTSGKLKYTRVAGDVDTEGEFHGEFQVLFSGGAIQTYPNEDYIKILITDELEA